MDETLDAGVVLVRGSAAGFAQEIRAGRHRVFADEPVADGGTDTGPGPYDLLLCPRGLNVDDHRAVRATEALAPRRSDGPLAAFEGAR